jgi:hypothetical protein
LRLRKRSQTNAWLRDWWGRVRLVVWGPSAQLLSVDLELQEKLEEFKAAGVELVACKACADLYGVADQLRAVGRPTLLRKKSEVSLDIEY